LVVTTIVALGLSHPFTVCETNRLTVPTAVVDGIGAPEEPVPPVEAEYHNKEVPVAVKAEAVAFWQ
jgi:hypothetical protein